MIDFETSNNPKVQEIMVRAQRNTTELGYWRDIATDLAKLVDDLEEEITNWKADYIADQKEVGRIMRGLEDDVDYYKHKYWDAEDRY